MNIYTLHGISTIFVMIAFVGICWWAFSPKRKERFKEAANLPFSDEQLHQAKPVKSNVSDKSGRV